MGGPHQKVQQAELAPQHALLAMLDQRIEDAAPRQQLARVLLDPQPGTHFQRQRQEGARRVCTGFEVQVVPQISMRQVLATLRLDHIGVVHVGLHIDLVQRVHVGQMGNRLARVGIRKPEPVAQAKARMAVQRQAEAPRQQLFAHHLAQRLAFRLQTGAGPTPVPGQAGAQALAASQNWDVFQRLHRGIAHQVHAAAIGARALPHAGRVDDGHEHQAQAFQQLLQAAVPAQTRHDAAQKRDHDLGTYALQTMHAAEQTYGRHVRIAAAQAYRIHREWRRRADLDIAHHPHVEQAAALRDDALQVVQFRQK